jgi:uncharacterized membrane protein
VAGKAIAAALVVVLILVAAMPAAAERQTIHQGEPAPYDGMIYDAAGVQLLIEDYRDLDEAKRLVTSKDGQLTDAKAAAEKQALALTELKEALDKERLALAFERGRAQGYKDTEAERAATLATIKEMLAEERSSRRWEKILSIIPIIGAAALLFTGGLF